MGLKLPLGIEDFAELREEGFYYVDKSYFIKQLLDNQFKASLITRPRRFGKTLSMSMLADFFDITRDSKDHFEKLAISNERQICKTWQNKWPVIFLTLKSIEGLDFDTAFERLKILTSEIARNISFLLESKAVNRNDKKDFEALCDRSADPAGIANSLALFTRMLSAHYGRQVILLIDEYDVPLAKASENGYYDKMLDVIRTMLGGALKTNPYLKLAVITGCLRISKESIFTGINNLVIDDISGGSFNEYVGFTADEVDGLLASAGMMRHSDEIKLWYDGYQFGATDIYCPWSVLNYLNDLQKDACAMPGNYWANTSHNGIIYRFISRSDLNVNDKFETLMSGGSIVTSVEENLTYDTINSSEENLWSLLYLTGYLTKAGSSDVIRSERNRMMALRIPNEEVKTVFESTIVEWFNESMLAEDRRELFEALWNRDVSKAEGIVSDILFNTISYYDYKESYYHAFLVGIFSGAGYGVESNYEYGLGRPDMVVKDKRNRRVMLIEVKHAEDDSDVMIKTKAGLKQFADKKYIDGVEKGYEEIIAYCIVFNRKNCRISEYKSDTH